jgi:tetratricopeptide (TPR) repeat protein
MAQIDIKTHLIAAEDLIRSGRGREGQDRLERILSEGFQTRERRRSIEPADRARLIQLLRRSGGTAPALEFGYDFVRGESAELTPPTPDEKLEYAAALIFSGLETEGLTLLDEVPAGHSPLIDLYRAFGFFARWEYEQAEPALERFLARTSEQNYFYRVGQLNRAASLVFLDRLNEAETLLNQLLKHAESAQAGLLRANALELIAQVHLKRNSLNEARHALQTALKLSPDPQSLYRLFIDKWLYVLDLKEETLSTTKREQDLKTLIQNAQHLKHFETLRDLNLQTALVEKDRNILSLLIAGTPYRAYRQKVRRALVDPPAKASLVFAPNIPLYEMWLAKTTDAAPDFVWPKMTRKRTRLLKILASDLYRPWRVPNLFQELFPGRWYDAQSAKNLLHQSIHELRRFLVDENLPLQVCWQDGFIFLQSTQSLMLTFDLESEPESNIYDSSLLDLRAELLLVEIEKHFAGRAFSKTELLAVSALPERTVQRHLNSLVGSSRLSRTGGGRSIRYLLP